MTKKLLVFSLIVLALFFGYHQLPKSGHKVDDSQGLLGKGEKNTPGESQLDESDDSADSDRSPASEKDALRASIEQQLSRQRIGGLTISEMTSIVAASGADGKVAEHSRFLWRATELLRVDPAACAALTTIYQTSDTPSGRKTLIADLLAQAGAPHAQKALTEVLQSPATQNDPARLELWQRLSFVEAPTRETLQVAQMHLQASGGEDRLAMIHSLGALASHAAEAGNQEAADALHLILEQELSSAPDSNSRLSAIVGLGNARNEKDIDRFVELLDSESELERGAAIRALGRQASNPEARRALASLVASPQQEAEIKDTAVRALGKGEVSETEYRSLSAAATNPNLAESTAKEIGITLTRKLDADNSAGWRAAVESLAHSSTGETAVQANGLLFLDNLRK